MGFDDDDDDDDILVIVVVIVIVLSLLLYFACFESVVSLVDIYIVGLGSDNFFFSVSLRLSPKYQNEITIFALLFLFDFSQLILIDVKKRCGNWVFACMFILNIYMFVCLLYTGSVYIYVRIKKM